MRIHTFLSLALLAAVVSGKQSAIKDADLENYLKPVQERAQLVQQGKMSAQEVLDYCKSRVNRSRNKREKAMNEFAYGFALQAASQSSAARKAFTRALVEYAAFPAPHVSLAVLAEQANNMRRAHKHLNEALKIDRDYLPAIVNKARIYMRQGKNEKALRFFKRANDIEYTGEALIGMARIFVVKFHNELDEKQKEYWRKKAIGSARGYMLQFPESPRAHLFLAKVYKDLGMIEKSVAKLEATHRDTSIVQGGRDDALKLLAQLYMQTFDLKNLEATLERLVKQESLEAEERATLKKRLSDLKKMGKTAPAVWQINALLDAVKNDGLPTEDRVRAMREGDVAREPVEHLLERGLWIEGTEGPGLLTQAGRQPEIEAAQERLELDRHALEIFGGAEEIEGAVARLVLGQGPGPGLERFAVGRPSHGLGHEADGARPVDRPLQHEGPLEALGVQGRMALLDRVAQLFEESRRGLHRGRNLGIDRATAQVARGEGDAQPSRLALHLLEIGALGLGCPIAIARQRAADDVEVGGRVAHAARDARHHREAHGLGARNFGMATAGRLQAEHAAGRRGNADRSAAVAALGQRDEPCRHRRGAAATRPSGRELRAPRVVRGAVERGLRGGQETELRGVGQTDRKQSPVDQPRRGGMALLSDVGCEEPTGERVGGAGPGDGRLEERRHPGQRALRCGVARELEGPIEELRRRRTNLGVELLDAPEGRLQHLGAGQFALRDAVGQCDAVESHQLVPGVDGRRAALRPRIGHGVVLARAGVHPQRPPSLPPAGGRPRASAVECSPRTSGGGQP